VTGTATSEDQLRWNIVGLLSDDPGADRVYEIRDAAIDLGEDLRLSQPIAGRVRLLRTNRGILAHADLRTALHLECSRCLREIDFPVDVRFQEEYLPALDLATGRPLSTDDEPDIARLTDHHELDLETPVREAILLAEPFAPLCQPDCPGLCIVCGLRLDEGSHEHPGDDIDPRLEALRGFQPDDA
jgi:Predicted metal-binding, possibly nucleic acid-binding protein